MPLAASAADSPPEVDGFGCQHHWCRRILTTVDNSGRVRTGPSIAQLNNVPRSTNEAQSVQKQ